MYHILKNLSTISQLLSIVDLIESRINFIHTLLGIFNEDLIKSLEIDHEPREPMINVKTVPRSSFYPHELVQYFETHQKEL